MGQLILDSVMIGRISFRAFVHIPSIDCPYLWLCRFRDQMCRQRYVVPSSLMVSLVVELDSLLMLSLFGS